MIIKENKITDKVIGKFKNEIFIYPTDTIYGLGCDATKKKLVEKIRKIKNRDNKPFSVIAPSVQWILNNFKVDKKLIKKYLPGPYTLLLEKKDRFFLSYISNNEFIGVRIPQCNFTKILQGLNVPIVTTSVNLSGENFANSVNEIDKRIFKIISIIVDGGKLSGKPSILIKKNQEVKR